MHIFTKFLHMYVHIHINKLLFIKKCFRFQKNIESKKLNKKEIFINFVAFLLLLLKGVDGSIDMVMYTLLVS